MSGNDERIDFGTAKLVIIDRKICYIRGRYSEISTCGHIDCFADDAYIIFKGTQPRLSRIFATVCIEHLLWGIDYALECVDCGEDY